MVEAVIHLGTHPSPFTFYLIFLISEEEKTQEHEISNKIEDNCKYLAQVYAIVHKTGSARSGMESGQRFWCKAIAKGNLLYRADSLELPEPPAISKEKLIDRAQFHWQRWGVQGQEFLKGADRYYGEHNYRLAIFLLHQAAESLLKALIQAILGYRIQMHNLAKLIKLTLLFTDDLKKIFKLETEEGVSQFYLLQVSYSQSRYSNEFNPDADTVAILTRKVTELYKAAATIYVQYRTKLAE